MNEIKGDVDVEDAEAKDTLVDEVELEQVAADELLRLL